MVHFSLLAFCIAASTQLILIQASACTSDDHLVGNACVEIDEAASFLQLSKRATGNDDEQRPEEKPVSPEMEKKLMKKIAKQMSAEEEKEKAKEDFEIIKLAEKDDVSKAEAKKYYAADMKAKEELQDEVEIEKLAKEEKISMDKAKSEYAEDKKAEKQQEKEIKIEELAEEDGIDLDEAKRLMHRIKKEEHLKEAEGKARVAEKPTEEKKEKEPLHVPDAKAETAVNTEQEYELMKLAETHDVSRDEAKKLLPADEKAKREMQEEMEIEKLAKADGVSIDEARKMHDEDKKLEEQQMQETKIEELAEADDISYEDAKEMIMHPKTKKHVHHAHTKAKTAESAKQEYEMMKIAEEHDVSIDKAKELHEANMKAKRELDEEVDIQWLAKESGVSMDEARKMYAQAKQTQKPKQEAKTEENHLVHPADAKPEKAATELRHETKSTQAEAAPKLVVPSDKESTPKTILPSNTEATSEKQVGSSPKLLIPSEKKLPSQKPLETKMAGHKELQEVRMEPHEAENAEKISARHAEGHHQKQQERRIDPKLGNRAVTFEELTLESGAKFTPDQLVDYWQSLQHAPQVNAKAEQAQDTLKEKTEHAIGAVSKERAEPEKAEIVPPAVSKKQAEPAPHVFSKEKAEQIPAAISKKQTEPASEAVLKAKPVQVSDTVLKEKEEPSPDAVSKSHAQQAPDAVLKTQAEQAPDTVSKEKAEPSSEAVLRKVEDAPDTLLKEQAEQPVEALSTEDSEQNVDALFKEEVATDAVEPFDCIKYGKPIQALKAGKRGFGFFELNVESGKYVPIYEVPFTRTTPKYSDLNACGINPVDSKMYCSIKQGELYITRIDSKSVIFVAKVPGFGKPYTSGTFGPDGTYFLMDDSAGTLIVKGLSNKKGFASKKDKGLLDLSKAQLQKPTGFHSAADVVVVNSDLDKTGKKMYMIVLNRGSLMVAVYDDRLGKFGKTWIMPYKAGKNGKKGKWNEKWGAGWSFGGKVFFAANKGDGVFEIDMKALDLTKTVKALSPFVIKKIGKASSSTFNDGANCLNAPDPWKTKIIPWDCKINPEPAQILRVTSGYEVKKLNLISGKYEAVYSIPYTRTKPTFKYLNAVGLSPIDGVPYGCLLFDEFPAAAYLVRIDHEKFEFLAKMPGKYDPIAGTFDSDGNYYFVHNTPDSSDPVMYSVSELDGMKGFNSHTAPKLPVFKKKDMKGLTLDAFYQFADIVAVNYDFEVSGTMSDYIMGINDRREVVVVKWNADSPEDSKTWRFTTTDVLSSQNASRNFGAAFNYKGRVFLAANDGVGLYETTRLDLRKRLIQLSKVGNSEVIVNTDGFNCWNIDAPFPPTKRGPTPSAFVPRSFKLIPRLGK